MERLLYIAQHALQNVCGKGGARYTQDYFSSFIAHCTDGSEYSSCEGLCHMSGKPYLINADPEPSTI